MLRGLYIAATGMIANEKKIDVVTNNMANANATSFKKDEVLLQSFEEVLISKMDGEYEISNSPKASDITLTELGNNSYEIETQRGFTKIKMESDFSRSQRMRFTVTPEGDLVTYYKLANGRIDYDAGYPVYGENGPIKVDPNDFSIEADGRVMSGGAMIDRLVLSAPRNVVGSVNNGVRIDRIHTDFTQGQLSRTDAILDFALEGDGFFKIQHPSGEELYTRNGSFKINADRQLVTTEGFPVMGFDGPIVLESNAVSVNEFGEILFDGEIGDKFDLVTIENIEDVRKFGSSYYQIAPGIEAEEEPFTGLVRQGMLESSNVNAVKEMIDMLTLYRNYESNQKLVKAYDDVLNKAANEIGRI